MYFYVGAKIVYTGKGKVVLNPRPYQDIYCRLKRGSVYTIREIDDRYIPHYGMVGIRVCELQGTIVEWPPGSGLAFEACPLADNFEPVVEVENKTDISALTKLLNTKSVDELVND